LLHRKKLEDDDKASAYAKLASLKSKVASSYEEWAKAKAETAKANESLKEAEKDPNTGEDVTPKEKLTPEKIAELQALLKLKQDEMAATQLKSDEITDSPEAKTEAAETIKKYEKEIADIQEKLKAGGGETKTGEEVTDEEPKVDEEAIKAAEKKVEDEKAKVKTAEEAKAALKDDATEDEKKAADKSIEDAKSSQSTAEAELEKLKGGTPAEVKKPEGSEDKPVVDQAKIDAAEKAVTDAKAKVTTAQKAYDDKKAEIGKETDEAKKENSFRRTRKD